MLNATASLVVPMNATDLIRFLSTGSLCLLDGFANGRVVYLIIGSLRRIFCEGKPRAFGECARASQQY